MGRKKNGNENVFLSSNQSSIAVLDDDSIEQSLGQSPLGIDREDMVFISKSKLSELINAFKDKSIQNLDDIDDNAQYLMVEKIVDSCTTIRKRKKITNLVCKHCGFDLEEQFGRSFEDLSDREKLIIPEVLKKHVQEANCYRVSSKKIISGAEMKGLQQGLLK